MKLDYFSQDEDTRFSEIVISYNERREKEEEDKELYTFIKDRTSILLYLIPVRNLFLDYDEASEIYLDLYKCTKLRRRASSAILLKFANIGRGT